MPQTIAKSRRFYYVYILANLSGMLYVGLTDHLQRRLLEHNEGKFDGFTKRYEINRLMYFETFTDSYAARRREIQIKAYRREKKSRCSGQRIHRGAISRPKYLLGVWLPRCARDL